MPNWIEGKLKIRGDKKNIKRFLEEELEEVIYKNKSSKNKVKAKKFKYDNFRIEATNVMSVFKFTNTRNYLSETKISTFGCGESKGKDVLVVGFEAAWLIDAEYFAEMSKKYDIDFKIYAFEQGKEFNQNIEVVKGEIIKDELIEFDDYIWECIDPTIGG